jgi:hypothetical protein
MMVRLLAEMRAGQEHMKEDLLARMEAKMDAGQEDMKTQTTSLTSRIEATHKKLMAAMETSHEMTISCLRNGGYGCGGKSKGNGIRSEASGGP